MGCKYSFRASAFPFMGAYDSAYDGNRLLPFLFKLLIAAIRFPILTVEVRRVKTKEGVVYVPPYDGGCEFCHQCGGDMEDSKMVNANVHRQCVIKRAKYGNPVAKAVAEELKIPLKKEGRKQA